MYRDGQPNGNGFSEPFYTAMTWEYLVGLLHYLFLRSSTILSMSIYEHCDRKTSSLFSMNIRS